MNNLQEIVALWDKYHYSIATDAMEYNRKLRQLLFVNSNVCDVSDANIEELISKRQAIDASIEAINSWNKSCSIGQQKRIENYIKQLPSAQPKRETTTLRIGRTRNNVTMWYECAECGEPVDQEDAFCRRCGRGIIHE